MCSLFSSAGWDLSSEQKILLLESGRWKRRPDSFVNLRALAFNISRFEPFKRQGFRTQN